VIVRRTIILIKIIIFLIILFWIVLISFLLFFFRPAVQKIISPIPDNYSVPVPVPTVTPAPSWRGEASYYSEDGCLGCSPTLTMANGERLDDARLTIAMVPETVRAYKLLNRNVNVRNSKTGDNVVATVSDTGGFSRYGRIADLSVATKLSIGCEDLCEVEISYYARPR